MTSVDDTLSSLTPEDHRSASDVPARAPVVSVTIPTLNAAGHLSRCLESLRRQSYTHLEVIVVDGGSRDDTPRLAAEAGATVVTCPGGLLAARCEGARLARGDYVLLLDSDQVLEGTALARAVALAEERGYDMLVLEEVSWRPRNWLQQLFAAHRRLVHRHVGPASLDPYGGTLLPRFFRRALLTSALSTIPQEVVQRVVHHDHAIIYLECWRLSRRVGLLRRAVFHQEPASLRQVWRRNFRYGRSLAVFGPRAPYWDLVRRRDRRPWPRRLDWEDIPLLAQSALLMVLLRGAQWAGLAWQRAGLP